MHTHSQLKQRRCRDDRSAIIFFIAFMISFAKKPGQKERKRYYGMNVTEARENASGCKNQSTADTSNSCKMVLKIDTAAAGNLKPSRA